MYDAGAMIQIMTLVERDSIRRKRRLQAVDALTGRLTGFARAHGGRYLLYGSAAQRLPRVSSDVDILVDFPSAKRLEAQLFAERTCAELGLRGDVRAVEMTSARLLERAQADGRVLA